MSDKRHGNPLLADRRSHMNSNGFVLGTSGAGKSFNVKAEMADMFLDRTFDKPIVLDPVSLGDRGGVGAVKPDNAVVAFGGCFDGGVRTLTDAQGHVLRRRRRNDRRIPKPSRAERLARILRRPTIHRSLSRMRGGRAPSRRARIAVRPRHPCIGAIRNVRGLDGSSGRRARKNPHGQAPARRVTKTEHLAAPEKADSAERPQCRKRLDGIFPFSLLPSLSATENPSVGSIPTSGTA